MRVNDSKGKQKSVPKLKAILANPDKKRCPILDEKELTQLKHLLQNAIAESKLEPRIFATMKGICLGLESSLRKINNQTSSCVFVSLSIKPNYLVGLIARNAEFKDGTQPVYAQPKLENVTEEIFGVQALCMVFPKDLMKISSSVNQWVEEVRKIKHSPEEIKNKFKKKNKLEIYKTDTMIESTNKSENDIQDWSGDFISFGKCGRNIPNPKVDSVEAVDALSQIIDKIPISLKDMPEIVLEMKQMEVCQDNTAISYNVTKEGESSDSEDFLKEYKSLIVHKIQGNPKKNKKKKLKVKVKVKKDQSKI